MSRLVYRYAPLPLLLLLITITAAGPSWVYATNTNNNDNNELSLSSSPNGRHLLSLRDTFLESSWVDSTSAGQSSMKFIRSLPRIDYHSKTQPHAIPTIPRDNTTGEKDYEGAIKEYVGGVTGIAAFLVACGILCMFSCCTFCMVRCSCNSCGGRRPTKSEYYDHRTVMCARISVCILVIFLAIACAFGWSGNVGVSTGIDELVAGGDAVVDYSTEWANVMTTAWTLSTSALRRVTSLNTTVFSVVPSTAQLAEYKQCALAVFNVTNIQASILVDLRSLNTTIKSLPSFTSFSNLLDGFQDSIDLLPNLPLLNSQLYQFNASLSAINLNHIQSQLITLNTSMTSFKQLPSLNTDLVNFRSTAYSLPINPLASMLNQYESAVAALPNLDYLYGNISNNGAAATIRAQLTQLNNSLNLMPNTTRFIEISLQLNSSMTQLRGSIAVRDKVISLQAALVAMPKPLDMRDSLLPLQSLINNALASSGNTSVTTLMKAVNQTQAAVNSLPNVATLITFIDQTSAAVTQVKAIDLMAVARKLQVVNATLDKIDCIIDVFNLLTKINKTLATLPSAVNDLFDMKPDIDRAVADRDTTRAQIQDGYDGIMSVNSSLSNLPNFPTVRQQVKDVNATITTLPDLHAMYNNLQSLNNSLASIPKLQPYLDQLVSLNSSLSVPNLDNIISRLNQLNDTIATMPSPQLFVDNARKLNKTLHDPELQPIVQLAYDSLGVVPVIPSPSPKNELLSGVDALRTAIHTRPDSTSMKSSLTQANNTINNLPDITSMTNSITDLDTQIATFPSITTLSSQVTDAQSQMASQDQLKDLLAKNQLMSTQSSIDSLGNLQTKKQQVDDLSNSINDIDIDNVINQFDTTTTLTDQQKSDAIAKFDDIQKFRDNIPDLDDYITQGMDGVDRITKYREDVMAKQASYIEYRNEYRTTVNRYDGLRLLFFNLLMLIPFATAFLGVCGALFMYGCPALVMSLLFFPLIATLFIFAAVGMPVAMVMSDHCDAPMVHIKAQYEGDSFPADDFSFLNLNSSMAYNDLIDYFVACEGATPEALVKLQNPDQILADQGYNITDLVNQVKTSGNTGGEPITLAAPIIEQLDDLLGIYGSALALMQNTALPKLNCTRTQALYTGIVGPLCSTFGPQFALSIVMFFVMGICMVPGVCCGIRSYKRFNENWHVGAYELAQQQQQMEDIEMDDYNAKYRHRRQVWN